MPNQEAAPPTNSAGNSGAYHEIRAARLAKHDAWRKLGIEPYPASSRRTHTLAEARALPLDSTGQSEQVITVAGRIVAERVQGGLGFFDLTDGGGRLQLLVKKDDVAPEQFEQLSLLDLGDFIEASGTLMTTKRGELTVAVSNWRLLSKSLSPLPDKWHGLQDEELQFRDRPSFFIANPEEKRIFAERAKATAAIRHFLDERNFLEVETPILQNIPGGASAKPFVTHYNAYDTDVFLRIAPELYLKRLLVAGFDRVYEIGPCFRNEGVDATHNPEYTEFEFYAAYMDEEQLMQLTEELMISIATVVKGKPELTRGGQTVKLERPFARVSFAELTGGENSDTAFKQAAKNLIEPTFVTNHPTEMIPLAKRAEDGQTVRSFQLIIAGIELVKAFAELNDPVDQRARFLEQENARSGGDEEAQRLDEDFVRALELGMPPAAGFGMGIERLMLLLSGKHAIRDVLLFPYVRPKNEKEAT